MKEILDAIEKDWEEHLKRYQRYVSQPSVSGTGQGMEEMAEMLCSDLAEIGCVDVHLVETLGYPVIYGHLDEGQEKTVLIYGMYDVQPVEVEEWMVDPFSGSIVDLPGFGECIVSRGITNQKGPLAGVLNAIAVYKKMKGKLPVNVKFVLEGEEELGSVNLPLAIDSLYDKLSTCDNVFFPSFSQSAEGKVELYMGSKGIIHVEATCRGGDWGGPVEDNIHGCNAVWMDNPAWRLIHAVASLKDKDEVVQIDGFYDDVAGPWPGDEEILDKMMETFSEKEILNHFGVKKFKFGLEGKELLKRYFYSPELNIDGIASGYYGEGSKTLLPKEAIVKLDIRLVPNMDPYKVMDSVKQHFIKHGFPEIELEMAYAYNWSRSGMQEPVVKALMDAMEELGHSPEPWITMAGSAPFSIFQSKLGIPVAFGGLGHGSRQHTPNEYAIVEGMKELEKSCVLFFKNVSK